MSAIRSIIPGAHCTALLDAELLAEVYLAAFHPLYGKQYEGI
ncbi:hypothetical protein [Nitrosospira sp. Nsp13]|nr:hypothetical protein [Nitrosospira sp. Nsp13]